MDRGNVVASGTPAELADDERVRSAYLGGGSTSSGSVRQRVEGRTAVENTQEKP
jgi:branched-chain amino acid transport system ATP-binding protein